MNPDLSILFPTLCTSFLTSAFATVDMLAVRTEPFAHPRHVGNWRKGRQKMLFKGLRRLLSQEKGEEARIRTLIWLMSSVVASVVFVGKEKGDYRSRRSSAGNVRIGTQRQVDGFILHCMLSARYVWTCLLYCDTGVTAFSEEQNASLSLFEALERKCRLGKADRTTAECRGV